MKDYKRIEHMRNLNDSLIWERMKRCYDYGYEDGKADTPFTDTEEAEEKAYNRGLNDAWEVARKLVHPRLGGYTEEQKHRIFVQYISSDSILQNFSASEAIAKIKAYEDKQKQDAEIKVGDEVIVQVDRIGFVTGFDVLFDRVYVTTKDGWSDAFGRSFVKKTGRTFPQIAEVLKEMRGAENDE